MAHIMLAVDQDPSTDRAFAEILKIIHKDEDEVYLCSITSSWDYLNEEKNTAKLELFKFENYCEQSKIKCHSIQLEASSVEKEFVLQIDKHEIDVFYIGATGYLYTVDPDNMIFSLFSTLKRWVFGTIKDYIIKYAKDCSVEVVI